MSVEELAEISRHYGADSDYVIAGGGNTSFKDGDTMYVKASGAALADASAGAFVRVGRRALDKIWDRQYSADSEAREREVLADLMAARLPGEEAKRPSVETTLHGLLPFAFVVHLHPALVNGVTCSRQGQAAAERLFPQAVWIPSINPGYILALEVKKALAEFKTRTGGEAQVIFLQNHGVFVGADSAGEIRKIYEEMIGRLQNEVKRKPDFSGGGAEGSGGSAEVLQVLAQLAGGAAFVRNREVARLVESEASFAPVASAFTPDHIVYAGSDPLFTAAGTKEGIELAWKAHIEKTGRPAKIVAVQGLGVFGAGTSEKAAGLALELFLDSVKVAVFSESFGGGLFMTRDKIDFINNWEVEAFRTKVSI
ncbi:MAG: class II aldolase/adducin family protein [Spirochaetes bacterium]|nr:class II aldolase/adducin family protein [Spirochaetota bacterium]